MLGAPGWPSRGRTSPSPTPPPVPRSPPRHAPRELTTSVSPGPSPGCSLVASTDGPRHARLDGWGYSREYPVEQWMRDAKLEEREEGTSDIMRIVISRHLP
ncbi:acyl-CoA dehydrogenase family protein [Streptomyces subrutilus]|uniref:acyl-CoA dehydrogenase family protein n=1 Tax=Streptomyces subrutilus TaxID=36818 RepID=UPI00244DA2E8|nr:acyl-CoA dehydrogenase family protein [Streptomyces subrutilus]